MRLAKRDNPSLNRKKDARYSVIPEVIRRRTGQHAVSRIEYSEAIQDISQSWAINTSINRAEYAFWMVLCIRYLRRFLAGKWRVPPRFYRLSILILVVSSMSGKMYSLTIIAP